MLRTGCTLVGLCALSVFLILAVVTLHKIAALEDQSLIQTVLTKLTVENISDEMQKGSDGVFQTNQH